MRLAKKFFTLTVLFLLAANALLVMVNYLLPASVRTPFGWQDEGYVLGPALTVYKGGWKDYRCRGDQIVCYGAVQTFIDVGILKALPDAWLEKGAIRPSEGANWFYQSEYPNAFLALRLSRVFFSILLFAALGWASYRYYPSKRIAAFVALSPFAFSAYLSARQGLKNDYTSALHLLIFLFLANRAFCSLRGRAWKWFTAAMVFGVLGLGIKVGILIPLVLLPPAYILFALHSGRKVGLVFRDLVIAGIAALATFVGSNPNLGISLTEANWISSFLTMATRSPSLTAIQNEILQAFLPTLWPLLTLLTLFMISGRRLLKLNFARWGYLLGVPILWSIVSIKAAWIRPVYYLPALLWTFFLVPICLGVPDFRERLGKLRAAPILLFLVTGVLGWQALRNLPSEWHLLQAFEKAPFSYASSEPWKVFACRDPHCFGRRWIVDRALHAAVPASLSSERLSFFDSFTDSPEDFRALFSERGKDSDTEILVACWTPEHPGVSDPSFSPAAAAWARATKAYCPKTETLDERLAFSFENGSRPVHYAVIPLSVWRSRESELVPKPSVGSTLSPRMLSGAHFGVDTWYGPVILSVDASLRGTFRFLRPVRKVRVPFESTCKSAATVSVKVGDESAAADANVRAVTCEKRPWVCRYGLEGWWTERVPVTSLVLPVSIPAGVPTAIEVQVSGGEKDRCRIALQHLRFEE